MRKMMTVAAVAVAAIVGGAGAASAGCPEDYDYHSHSWEHEYDYESWYEDDDVYYEHSFNSGSYNDYLIVGNGIDVHY
jgi:hypothetical protein